MCLCTAAAAGYSPAWHRPANRRPVGRLLAGLSRTAVVSYWALSAPSGSAQLFLCVSRLPSSAASVQLLMRLPSSAAGVQLLMRLPSPVQRLASAFRLIFPPLQMRRARLVQTGPYRRSLQALSNHILRRNG